MTMRRNLPIFTKERTILLFKATVITGAIAACALLTKDTNGVTSSTISAARVEAQTETNVGKNFSGNVRGSWDLQGAPGGGNDGAALLNNRSFHVITTAALPWMTGTSVNPLLRAAYLARMSSPPARITLVVPWLGKEKDRLRVYGPTHNFTSESEQELIIREWLETEAGMPEEASPRAGIQIQWYPANYVDGLGSIVPTGDICTAINHDDDMDVGVLEEPGHLNWLQLMGSGCQWRSEFNRVIGVLHTNYRAYISEKSKLQAAVVGELSKVSIRDSCDRIIKLSDVFDTIAPEKEVIANVHGVRTAFLVEGMRRGQLVLKGGMDASMTEIHNEEVEMNSPTWNSTAHQHFDIYFIGKLLWTKGLDKLVELEELYMSSKGNYFPIDIYGDGHDRSQIETAFDGVPANFGGYKDHSSLTEQYKIFVNPSTSEVLCTATMEAISMGKFVVIPVHPSNDSFLRFPNCLAYKSDEEFVNLLEYAMLNDPKPLSPESLKELTWEAATDRFLEASGIF